MAKRTGVKAYRRATLPKRAAARAYRLGEVLELTGGQIRVGPVRAVLLTESAFVFLQRVVHEQMPELVKYGFYEMGFRAGLDLSKETRRARDKESGFRLAVESYRQAGYGDVEVISYDLDKPEIRLAGHSLIEASAALQSGIYLTPRSVDHYSRGLFAGLVSELLGKEVICEELKCEFRGDGACEFTILPFGGMG